MKIAIPVANGRLSLHFGHCEKFVLVDVDENTKKIVAEEDTTPPPHEPGVLPRWLADQKANVIIAGGMGMRAQQLFTQNNISVVVGAESLSPRELVEKYLSKTLVTGENLCDH